MKILHAATAPLVFCSLALFGCSDDKKPSEPEIIRSAGDSGESRTASAPEFVRTASGGTSSSIAPGGPLAATGAESPALGLTLRRTESAEVPADEAFVVTLLAPRPPGPPSTQLSSRDQTAIIDALAAAGALREDLSFDTSQTAGPFATVNVRVPIDRLQTDGKRFVDAIESVVGRNPSGARFSVRDCTLALTPLRQKAYEAIKEDAAAFARSVSLPLGAVIAVTEVPTPIYGPSQSDPCGPGAASPKSPSAVLPLDADPKVKLSFTLSVTHSLGANTGGSPAPSLTAKGTGSATAKADEAYVVVMLEPSGPPGSQPITAKQRAELNDKLGALKIDEEAIEIATVGPGSPTLVSVEVDVNDLPKRARDVAGVVEDVLGRGQFQGIWFSHSNCLAVLAEAQKQAFNSATQKAKVLAEAANTQIASLAAIAEADVQPTYGPQPAPCSEDIAQAFGYRGPPGFRLQSFDAEPEFTVEAALAVTYFLAGQ